MAEPLRKAVQEPIHGLPSRSIRELGAKQKIFRFLSSGDLVEFSEVEFLACGGIIERTPQGAVTLYEGMPPYMAFSAPSGYLGRQIAGRASRDGHCSPCLSEWSDDDCIHYLFTQSLNLPGNLVFGEASLQREIALLQKPMPDAVNKLANYEALAEQTQEATYGASIGGEQPKFLWNNVDTGPVLVKFAHVGSRMASLLPMEHLALRTLREFAVPAAITQVYFSGAYVFLEVVRFDRVGSTGRKGLLSAAAIDDEFFGLRGNWSEFAQCCRRKGYIQDCDIDFVHTLEAFSELIGNKDRHLENISVLINDAGSYAGMAPAYDILPMLYAARGGVEPDLIPIIPSTSIRVPPKIWSVAAHVANRFWEAVATEELGVPISGEFRELARINQRRTAEFASTYLENS